MDSQLQIQKFLRTGGSLGDLQRDPYNLSIDGDAHGNLVNFKYDHINSDLDRRICREARGLILSKKQSWSVVSWPFPKFFNAHNESRAADIDWDTAVAEEKVDGTCVPMYHWNGEWRVHTLGTVDARGPVGNSDWTFQSLFWDRWDQIYGRGKLNELNPGFVYVTELCTGLNTPVTQYEQDRIVLLTARDRATLQEREIGEWAPDWFDKRETWDLSSMSEVRSLMDTLRPDEEGFVVRDKEWNRIKIKQKSYVQRHQIKSNITERKHGMVEAIQEGYADDFVATFPEFKGDYEDAKAGISALVGELQAFWDAENGKTVDPDDHQERKEFALAAKDFDPAQARHLLFQRLSGDIAGFREGIREMDTGSLVAAIETLS